MDEGKLAEQLRREGFGHTYAWQDGPNAFYPDHTHDTETCAHRVIGRDDVNYAWRGENVPDGRALRCACWCGALGAHGTARLPIPYWRKVKQFRQRWRFVVQITLRSFAPHRTLGPG